MIFIDREAIRNILCGSDISSPYARNGHCKRHRGPSHIAHKLSCIQGIVGASLGGKFAFRYSVRLSESVCSYTKTGRVQFASADFR